MTQREPTAWSWSDVAILALGSLALTLLVVWTETPDTGLSLLNNPNWLGMAGAGMVVALAAGLPLWTSPVFAMWLIALAWALTWTIGAFHPSARVGAPLMLLTVAALAQAWFVRNRERRLRPFEVRHWLGGTMLLLTALLTLAQIVIALWREHRLAQVNPFAVVDADPGGFAAAALVIHIILSLALSTWWLRWAARSGGEGRQVTLADLAWMPGRMRAPGETRASLVVWRASWLLSMASLACLIVGLITVEQSVSELGIFSGLGRRSPLFVVLWSTWALARMLELGSRAVAIVALSWRRVS